MTIPWRSDARLYIHDGFSTHPLSQFYFSPSVTCRTYLWTFSSLLRPVSPHAPRQGTPGSLLNFIPLLRQTGTITLPSSGTARGCQGSIGSLGFFHLLLVLVVTARSTPPSTLAMSPRWRGRHPGLPSLPVRWSPCLAASAHGSSLLYTSCAVRYPLVGLSPIYLLHRKVSPALLCISDGCISGSCQQINRKIQKHQRTIT